MTRQINISGSVIGEGHPPFVIAEIGINHGGSLSVAKSMVSHAFRAGAECVKHQTHFVEDEMTVEAQDIFPPNASKSIWDVISECALTQDEEIELKKYAEDLGLIYLSTPFSRKAIDFLDDIGVPAFKIGSGEADNIPFIRHVASKGKPVILSTGMQSISAVRKSVEVFKLEKVEYALLECTNLYPSPPEIVSLRGVTELREEFPDAAVGFSDHSIGPSIALASVALGASILERHFTDSRYRKGPDISCSMDPTELNYVIQRSKEIYAAANNKKSRTAPEEDVYRFARGSVVADRDIESGTIITEKDIWVRRPGSGEIAAANYDQVIGCRIIRGLSKNEQLKWSDLEGVKP